MPLTQSACRFVYYPDGVGSPSQWTPYIDGDPGGSLVSNTAGLDFDDAYILSDGANSEQWFSTSGIGGSDPIRRVIVEAYIKSEGFYVGSVRLNLGVGADTVGGGSHLSYPQWTRVTESFDLTPDAMPHQWTWPEIENIDIGITSLTVGGEVRCTRLAMWVDTCDYVACPRCCCCCLCFDPILRLPSGTFEFDLGPDGTISLNAIDFSMPFCGYHPVIGGCWFQYGATLGDCGPDYDPPVVGTSGTYSLVLIGASIVAGVLNPLGQCADVEVVFALIGDELPAPIEIAMFFQPVLEYCEPYHQSQSDIDDVTFTVNGLPSTPGAPGDPILTVAGPLILDCSGTGTTLPQPP